MSQSLLDCTANVVVGSLVCRGFVVLKNSLNPVFFLQKVIYFVIVFIKPVLVLAFGLADGIIGCSIDLIPEGFPTFYNVVRYLNLFAHSSRVSFNSALTACLFRHTTLRRLGAGFSWGRRLGSILIFIF